MSYDGNRSFSPTGTHHGREESTSQYLSPKPTQPGAQSNDPRSAGNNGLPSSISEFQNAATNRATSPPYNRVRQPINDAITSTFDSNNSHISPELVQQITQNVIHHLQSQGLQSPQMPQRYAPPSVTDEADGLSSSAASPRLGRDQVYTPPSPHRTGEELPQSQSFGNMSPKNQSKADGDTSRQRDVSPYSQGSYVGFHPDTADESTPRPPAPERSRSDDGPTVLEKIWGKLFDARGDGLPRLSQFLRGIAVHLIEDYEPKGTLVVTPTKMQQFYKDTKLKDHAEIYPWELVFDDHSSSISRMFRELSVQHHLVQDRPDTRPDIPGLTPAGFATWFTLLLQAHPNHEFERLSITARDMPISNPDEKKERFPKELSRRLFPTEKNMVIARDLRRLMAEHCNVNLGSRQNSVTENGQQQARASSKPADRPSQPPSKAPDSSEKKEQSAVPAEKRDQTGSEFVLPPRRRSTKLDTQQQSILRQQLHEAEPSVTGSDTTFEEDTSEVITPQPSRPIERERKPYVALPGGGKNYDINDIPLADEHNLVDPAPTEVPLRRTNSISTAGRPSRGATVSVHQRPYEPDMSDLSKSRSATVHASDMPDLSKSRSATVHASDYDNNVLTTRTRHRARSNAGYSGSDTDTRLPRNSTYQRETPSTSKSTARARSPSRSKYVDDDLRKSAPDMGYGSYQSSSSYGGDSYRAPDRYEYRVSGQDSREARYEREARSRNRNSVNGSDMYGSATEDYFRGAGRENNVYYPAPNGSGQGHSQFPPNAYRDTR